MFLDPRSALIQPAKLLALLVHQRRLTADQARDALASGDARAFLIRAGACTAPQWDEWQRTAAGTRPVLSRYELGELIGEGGVGRVFAARDRTEQRAVALKVMRAEAAAQPAQREQFVREARLLQQLDHAHLVKGLRVAKEGETVFFAMEHLPGRCLQDVLAEEGRLDEDSALQIVVEVAAALEHLHAHGYVHRDVKPGNVIWSEERGAVLIDLGFAIAGDAAASGATTAGTVHYIAPEQARGDGRLDVRADIYSLGATLYHLVTGSLPFEGKTSEEVLAKQVLESLSGARIRALDLSPQLHYFLEKMMAKDPQMRFQDPAHLQREVTAFLQQQRQRRELEQRQKKPDLGDWRKRPRR